MGVPMGFYIRKSLGIGPLRLNLSKSGLGVSAGVRGARIGVSSTGRSYVHCGRGGIYYRKFMGDSPFGVRDHSQPAAPRGNGASRGQQDGVPRIETYSERTIDSGDVEGMVDSSAVELIEEVRRKQSPTYWWALVLGCSIAFAMFAGLAEAVWVGAVISVVGICGAIAVWVWERRRRRVELHYQLDEPYERAYQQVIAAFGALEACSEVWAIETEARVADTKYTGGAERAISRGPGRAVKSLPANFASNVIPPMLLAGKQKLHFLPDTILVIDGARIGTVGYTDIQSEATTTRFVEYGRAPADAKQVDTTWQYVNKKGGPDKRFKDNRQLPVLELGVLRLSSKSGLNEEIQASRSSAPVGFVEALRQMSSLVQAKPHGTAPATIRYPV